MDFNAQQMRADALIQEGRYKFVVKDAREKRSATGNDMLNLKLGLKIGDREVTQWSSLILIPKMFWKFEHFCKAVGLTDKMEAGRVMAQDCLGREGEVEIVQKTDNLTGELSNEVKDYIFEAQPEEPPVSLNDDLPNF